MFTISHRTINPFQSSGQNMSNGDFTELLAREESKEKSIFRNLQFPMFFFVATLLAAYMGNFLPNISSVAERALYETLLEPRLERHSRLYWKKFLELSKSGTVNALSSKYAQQLSKRNVSASADALLAKIGQGRFWSRNTNYLVKELGMTKTDASIVTEELKKEKKNAATQSKRRKPAAASKQASGHPAKGDHSEHMIRSWEGYDYYALPSTAIVADQTYFFLYFALFCLCYVAVMVGALFYCFMKTNTEQLQQRKQQQAIATALAEAAAQR